MPADSDSTIAWHRAQLKKLRQTLKDIETSRFTVGESSHASRSGKTQRTIADLQRKISQSLQIIAVYERQTPDGRLRRTSKVSPASAGAVGLEMLIPAARVRVRFLQTPGIATNTGDYLLSSEVHAGAPVVGAAS